MVGEGIRECMLSCEEAGGAGVVAADFALSELVEEPFALVVEWFGCDDFAAQIAEVGEPVAGIERKLRVDLFAQSLSERGAGAVGGDGDLQVAAAHDGREVEVAEGRVVDGVAEDVVLGGFLVDGAVDSWIVGRCDDEELASEVSCGVVALLPFDFTGSSKGRDSRRGLGRDNSDAGVGACRDSIFDSARLPAPMTRQGRAASLRKMGKRLIRYSPGRETACANGWCVALDRVDGGSGKLGAEGFVVGAGEVAAKVFVGLAHGEIAAQQALDGVGDLVGCGAVAERTSDARETRRPRRRRRSKRRRRA